MAAAIFAFFAGVMLLQFLPALPSPSWSSMILLFALLALAWRRGPRPVRLLPALLAGFAWAWWHGAMALSAAVIGPEHHGRDLQVVGRVSGLPRQDGRRLRFMLAPELVLDGEQTLAVDALLRLNWFHGRPALLRPGQRLLLRVRLKPPRGFSNPGGFDYEGWLFQRGIVATGYVRSALSGPEREALMPRLRQLSGNGPGLAMHIDAERQRIGEQLQRLAGEGAASGVLRALAIGDRSGLDAQHWRVFRATGTSHLVAISGLHVGLVAGFCFLLAGFLWRRSASLCMWLPAERAAALAAVAGALVYSALAGFAIPTQRALLMIGVAMLMLWRRGHLPLTQVMALALFGVLLIDPAAVLSWGFWLSFAAVAIIVHGSIGRPLQRQRGPLAVGIHLRIAVGLAPLLFAGFNQFSLISPLANLLAVPWVSLLTVPVLLIGLLLAALEPVLGPWPAAQALGLSAWSVEVLNRGLELLAATPFSEWWSHTPQLQSWLPAVVGVAWLLAPRGLPGRWLAIPLSLTLVLIKPPSPAGGEFEFTLLDVGQGLAAAIRTRDHVLIYDTGPRFSPDFDTGEAVIVPWLRHHGYRSVDRLVISHGDRDHAGGFASLQRAIPAQEVLWGAGHPGTPGIRPCHGPRHWQWDGVRFEILYPFDHDEWRRSQGGNHGSCVLKITSAAGDSLLLSGDIGVRTEAKLRARHGARGLASAVLVAPHHGSTTSSSAAFIAAVRPRHVLYGTGFLNRFGFPRLSVRRRYQAAGVQEWQTADHGAIIIHFGSRGPGQVRGWRQTRQRFWHRAAAHGGGASGVVNYAFV